jgi:predicted enzyme related to lactoylglutathione lyase
VADNDKPGAQNPAGVDNRLARHGHVSYLEIPAADIEQSAAFYEAVFDWEIRHRDEGNASFDDRSGNLIGRWVTGRAASREPGMLPFIYVDRIDEAVARISAHGGQVDTAPYAEGDLWVATFRDPAGNVMGIWQAGPR